MSEPFEIELSDDVEEALEDIIGRVVVASGLTDDEAIANLCDGPILDGLVKKAMEDYRVADEGLMIDVLDSAFRAELQHVIDGARVRRGDRQQEIAGV